ncbi:unnamed protein product [Ilex paraguariensis]|uniref:Carbonic anhydrase n=1 Tax=Ilex paraguariensis TaxID=185542 RepID=A0ABC8UBW6_9AQUA
MAARVAFFIVPMALLLMNIHATTTNRPGEAFQFSYSGATGPNKWGNLNPKFTECSHGKLQSPIDIVKKKAVLNKKLKPLTRRYYPANVTLVDNGFNVQVRYGENAGVLIVDGNNYTLKQMHWHSPSEHCINGVQHDAELHLVHMADDGNFSVVAILYRLGHADPIVAQIQKKLDELEKEVRAGKEEAHIALGTVNTKKLRRRTRKYYRYVGSLTTPPCSQNVIWHILGKVRSISKEQVKALKAPLKSTCKNNSRPVQALNGRQIELYDEIH